MILVNAVLGAIALTFATTSSVSASTMRGLGWATDNTFAPVIGSKPMITWYHHWQDGPVSQMPSKDPFVPMFWGPSKTSQWNSRVAEMKKKTPAYLMAFNEPDVSSQANMSPSAAASLFMSQIWPWHAKGVKIGSPAIVYNIDWMTTFLADIEKKGGSVDFICIHWYGSWKDLAKFKTWVTTVHSKFGKPIWIPELGITSASNPSQAQVKTFMMNAFSWMDTQSYVQRAAWFGSFKSNQPPDSYATGKNALFNSNAQLSDMGYWYGYSSTPDKRSLRARHHDIAARNATEAVEPVDDGEHCDSICMLREASIAQHVADLTTRAEIEL